jgi:hypothetical protein
MVKVPRKHLERTAGKGIEFIMLNRRMVKIEQRTSSWAHEKEGMGGDMCGTAVKTKDDILPPRGGMISFSSGRA